MENSLIKQFKNTFEGGLDTDAAEAYLKSNTYRDAHNVSLVTNGKFFSLTNIQGTFNTGSLPGTYADCNIIGVFKTRFLYEGFDTNANGLLIFGFDNNYFKIWGAVPVTGDPSIVTFYELYQEAVGGRLTLQSANSDILIDAIGFSENNFDTVYFTDNYAEPRKIRCIIPFSYTPNFLTETEIGLFQRKALGLITGAPASGGTLLTGTYQAAYQLCDTSRNQYTRYSLLTNPVHIYTSDSTPKAGIGLPSSSKITLTIVLPNDEAVNYPYFRVALVKNIYAEGTDAATLNSVGVTKIESIATYTTSSTSDFTTLTYDIKSDAQYDSTTVDEIVTDLLAIDHVKTMTIKRNRLLIGNITLKNLDYDNGNPMVSGGSVLKYADGNTSFKDTFTKSTNSSKYVGYFRNEVYRFAISYFDKYGNFSIPKTLDLSAVIDNGITTPIKDMKFPDRNTYNGTGYNILNTNNQCLSLGLRLTSITNHPSWAVGFVILRAKRKKRIQFQTPIFPVAHIWLPGALDNFPVTAAERSGTKTYSSATPVGPLITGIPYNMFHGAFADTTDNPYTADNGGILQGETRDLIYKAYIGSHIMMYPDSSMYSKSPYTFQGNEIFESVDATLLNMYFTVFDDNNITVAAAQRMGGTTGTSVSGAFSATLGVNQYYSCTFYGALNPLRTTTYPINNAKFIENLSSGTSINGFNLMDPSKFTIPNVGNSGYPFTNQRHVVAEINNNPTLLDTPMIPLRFYYNAGSYNISDYDYYDADHNVNANYWTINGNLATQIGAGLYPHYLNVVEIANITVPQNDNRYGGTDDFNEFIFTGTQVNFTAAEQASIQSGGSVPKTVDIWGGDCFVSYHTFKISDSTCDITGPLKTELVPTAGTATDATIAYDRVYTTPSASILHYPYFHKNASQYITLVLESEFIGSVRDIDTCDIVNTYNGVSIWGALQPYKSRAPLGYNYNINLKKQNDQKIFVSVDSNIPIITKFKARVYYSDQKIYNSLINGFDTIRVNNYYDYEEKYGRLVKLANAGDNLYGIQDRAIFYIPLNERVIEVTDASQLAVRSGDLLGLQLYLSNTKGSQTLQGIVENGKFVFGVDTINKQIFKISGQELSFISDKGMISQWQENFPTAPNPINEQEIRSFYDYLKDELWIWRTNGEWCYIWNDDYQIWTSKLDFQEASFVPFGESHRGAYGLASGISMDGQVFLVSSGANTIYAPTLNLMYFGNYSNLFDTYVYPYVTFIINPELEHAKTFDNMLINSTDRLLNLDMVTTKEVTFIDQAMTTIDLTNQSNTDPFYRGGEGGYMLKTLRDHVSHNNSRMRGLYGKATLTWNTNTLNPSSLDPAIQVGLISVVTNARLSSKIF